MLFGSAIEWWGQKNPRSAPHSGLDIQLFLNGDGRLKTLKADTKIPLIYSGQVINITKDFIGFSVFARHDLFQDGKQLFSFYGHLRPEPEILNRNFPAGTVIGRLAEAKGKAPSHLHLSLAFLPTDIADKGLTWSLLEKNESISFLDPLNFI